MRAFARFKGEIWCRNLAYGHKLAKQKWCKVYTSSPRLVCDNRRCKGNEDQRLEGNSQDIFENDYQKNGPKKIWVDQWTEFAGEFKKFCSSEGVEIYSTMSENKAAFAERTIRSLKNTLYCYMEDYAYKYIQKLRQFIATMKSRNNRSIDMKPNHVKNSDFMSLPYSQPLREYKKPKF